MVPLVFIIPFVLCPAVRNSLLYFSPEYVRPARPPPPRPQLCHSINDTLASPTADISRVSSLVILPPYAGFESGRVGFGGGGGGRSAARVVWTDSCRD